MTVSKHSHVLRFWGLEFPHMDLGGHCSAHHSADLSGLVSRALGPPSWEDAPTRCSKGTFPRNGKEDTDLLHTHYVLGFPGGASGKEPSCQSRRCNRRRFDPWVGKIPWRGHVNPLQYYCLENTMDKGAWRAIVHRVSKSQTWVKCLSMHARHRQRMSLGIPFLFVCFFPHVHFLKFLKGCPLKVKVLDQPSYGTSALN